MGKMHENPMAVTECQKVIRSVMAAQTTGGDDSRCINIYDIRLTDTAPACGMNWPPEMPAITKMLGVRLSA